ncbi:MAG: YebC/PmpR family DNA-binding transcriptional regulator [Candidatus Doudnabacteria bacterium CG10_big_fil_rev_8_21_14_0_10_41_10]|uniref:Probable transcriptional regulatory protein COT91_05435 n=1 Tax=Candidatus Doudnabacteria bacterium CG10_big_fil_rev_8_21_14_0_10_41_10 TaxID=1974551 RepID=A0A2H0VC63_9BACT|nr:MAG: YebC/PmpR family DNA-binding transcriptional regulator [Candidatus Doudnabacteria bacterium CG10_big_fil_rev_8_21_14_0_10_41_10]
MSGHSKWSKIKHKKGAADKKKGLLFSRLSKQITIAARDGTDMTMNFKLRLAVDLAKQSQMPKDNIQRAVDKAAGAGVEQIELVTYEGYGPFGTAFIIETGTDNKNRTTSEIRHTLEKNGGSLGQQNSVAWNFESKGQILVEKGSYNLQELELLAIDAGAEDVIGSEEGLEIYTSPINLNSIKEFLEKKGFTVASAEIIMEAKNKVELKDEDKEKIQKLLEVFDENEDVIAVHTSANL